MNSENVTLSKSTTTPQKRALFYVYDGGTGVGHLRMLSLIANRLQGRLSCLIVTGHRAAAHWFVPEKCEYIHIPSWDSLLLSRARYWGREPFISLEDNEAIRLRKDMLSALISAYRPDAIFVDHLPLGAREELSDIIRDTPCLKYFVGRGIQNESFNLRQLTLGGQADQYLKSYYHRLLIALDQKVFDFSKRYNTSTQIRDKTLHTGYVINIVTKDVIRKTREDRGLKSGDVWVVASAGGGQLGESLIESCLELARVYPDIFFDIVQGPRSKLPWEDAHRAVIAKGKLRLHKETHEMAYMHAAADLVISSGGYSSFLETLQGNAKILCFPYRMDRRDEPYQHALCLKKFVDIELSTELSQLPIFFKKALVSIPCHEVRDRRGELDFNGTAFIENIVLQDLGLN